MPEQKQFSLIKPHFINLSGSGNQLNGVVAERNIEQPKEEYRGLSVEPNKHIIVLHRNDRNELEWQIDGNEKKEQFKNGDLIINPAGLDSNPQWRSDVELLVLAVHPEFVEFVAEEMNCPDKIGLFPNFRFEDKFIRLLTQNLVNEFENPSQPDLVYAESLCYALVSHLIRKYSREGDRATSPSKHGLPPAQLGHVIDFINTHIGADLKLEQIADVAGFSPSHFITLFKNATGLTPHQYIIRQKVERAKKQLTNTDQSISEIALSTGFSDQSHLTRVMRAHTGLTPRKIQNH